MGLMADNLLRDCQTCGGTGEKPVSYAASSSDDHSFSQEGHVPGSVVGSYDRNPCGACGGTGKELTEDGKAVGQVVEHIIKRRKAT